MKFTTTIIGDGNKAGIEVPEEIVSALDAGKRPPVVVTINGQSYRSSIAVMGGKYMVGVSSANRDLTGASAGDTVDVDLEVDTQPRVIEVPDDLAAALEAEPEAKDLQPLVLPDEAAELEPVVLPQADTPAPAIQPAVGSGFLGRWLGSAEARELLTEALDRFDGRDPHGFSFRPAGADDQVDDELDPLDPLILPAGVGPKDPFGAPVVCDADAAVPTGPFAFVTDTDALLSERGHHRLLMEPTANDWVI